MQIFVIACIRTMVMMLKHTQNVELDNKMKTQFLFVPIFFSEALLLNLIICLTLDRSCCAHLGTILEHE